MNIVDNLSSLRIKGTGVAQQKTGNVYQVEILRLEEIDRVEAIKLTYPEGKASFRICCDIFHLLICDTRFLEAAFGYGARFDLIN